MGLATENAPAAESALVHRLLEDGDNPNDWTVLSLAAPRRPNLIDEEALSRVLGQPDIIVHLSGESEAGNV